MTRLLTLQPVIRRRIPRTPSEAEIARLIAQMEGQDVAPVRAVRRRSRKHEKYIQEIMHDPLIFNA